MHRAVALVGTTASGKSALAVEAALAIGGVEIVSVDSMAVYRAMDIGTAKASLEARAAVPHHLIDVLDPSEECTVSLFQALAEEAMVGIIARGNVPLLVGGTGLYHRAVIDQLEIPGQFPSARATVEAWASTVPPEELHARLATLDPAAAAKIEPSNVRRLVRALEVIEGSGRPFSSYGPGLSHYGSSTVVQVGRRASFDEVDRAIEARVATWMDAGFLDEVRQLECRPEGLSRTAAQAIGYRELLAHLAGSLSLASAIDATIVRTRSLARRQRSWFERDPRVSWHDDANALRTALLEAIERVASGDEMRD